MFYSIICTIPISILECVELGNIMYNIAIIHAAIKYYSYNQLRM